MDFRGQNKTNLEFFFHFHILYTLNIYKPSKPKMSKFCVCEPLKKFGSAALSHMPKRAPLIC
jgi:hypothetical protein